MSLLRRIIFALLSNRKLKSAIVGILSLSKPLNHCVRFLYSRLLGDTIHDENHTHTEFIDINLDCGVLVRFSTAALIDMRGIGRVTREILKKLEQLDHKDCETSRCVHFFSTIHWCPKTLPPSSCVMIHDVIPLIFPEHFGSIAKKWNKVYAPIARQASLILTISNSSAKDISRYLDIPPEKILVIHNGVTAFPRNGHETQTNKSRYIVYLGSNDYHKNLDVVIEALTLLPNSEISLYLIGVNSSVMEKARKLGVSNKIKIWGRLNDNEIETIISNAIALVFPSLYEGFGLPPLEAALLGTPSICSERPAMTETLKDAAIFCAPDKPSQWATAIRSLATDNNLRSTLKEKAFLAASQYTWDRFMDELTPALISIAQTK